MKHNLEQLVVLIIDAHPGMRAQLRSMLDSFGVAHIHHAVSAGDAVRKLRERRFDLILCAYDLGDNAQDGQHLLEDLRQRKLIPLDAVFIMISGERAYERVVGAAELAPNDYILKPLTPGSLFDRLQRALDKRAAFRPIWQLMAENLPEAAIDEITHAQLAHPAHYTELLRLRAELLLGTGRRDEAEAAYRDIIAARPLPWARLGLARTLFARQAHDEAETVLTALIDESEHYLDARDLLARVREAQGKLASARHTLAQALERSPHRLSRLRSFGEIAMKSGALEEAETAQTTVVEKGKRSEFGEAEDHLRLIRTQLQRQRTAAAATTLEDLTRTRGHQPSAPVCIALGEALLARSEGRPADARAAARRAATLATSTRGLSLELRHATLSCCLENGLTDEGSTLTTHLLRTAEDENAIARTRAVLEAHGAEALSRSIEQQLHAEVKEYIAAGARSVQAGDYDTAVSDMMNAVRRMPGNAHVLFNAALALLRHIEHAGWNERFARQAHALLMRTRRLDPTNPRLDAIERFLHSMLHKYGIQAEAFARKQPARPASRPAV